MDDQFVDNLLSFASLINSNDLETLKLVQFPFDHLDLAVRLAHLVPGISLSECLHRIYPFETLYQHSTESTQAIKHMFKKLGVKPQADGTAAARKIVHVQRHDLQATVDYQRHGKQYQIQVIIRRGFVR